MTTRAQKLLTHPSAARSRPLVRLAVYFFCVSVLALLLLFGVLHQARQRVADTAALHAAKAAMSDRDWRFAAKARARRFFPELKSRDLSVAIVRRNTRKQSVVIAEVSLGCVGFQCHFQIPGNGQVSSKTSATRIRAQSGFQLLRID